MVGGTIVGTVYYVWCCVVGGTIVGTVYYVWCCVAGGTIVGTVYYVVHRQKSFAVCAISRNVVFSAKYREIYSFPRQTAKIKVYR